jgi:hypothetical protein
VDYALLLAMYMHQQLPHRENRCLCPEPLLLVLSLSSLFHSWVRLILPASRSMALSPGTMMTSFRPRPEHLQDLWLSD